MQTINTLHNPNIDLINTLNPMQDINTNLTYFGLFVFAITFLVHTLQNYTIDSIDTNALELIEQCRDDRFLSMFIFNKWSATLIDIFSSNPETLFDSVHYLIYHGAKQYLILATFNSDLTFTYHAAASVDLSTTVEELARIRTQFMDVTNMLFTNHPNLGNIQLTVWCGDIFNLRIMPNPFNPLSDYLAAHDWDLLAFVHSVGINIHMYTSNVPSNLNKLSDFIPFLVRQCENFLEMSIIVSNENSGTNTWKYLQATHQLIRYIESFYNIHGHIEPIDTTFSNMVEFD